MCPWPFLSVKHTKVSKCHALPVFPPAGMPLLARSGCLMAFKKSRCYLRTWGSRTGCAPPATQGGEAGTLSRALPAFTQGITSRPSQEVFAPVPMRPGGYIGVEKLPKSSRTMPSPAGAGVPGKASAAGGMLPAPCLRSGPALLSAGCSCALPADLSAADARPRRALLPGRGCCVGPGSIAGPGLPRERLISSDLSQGSGEWQPVKCHFALSRSRFNPFPPFSRPPRREACSQAGAS